MFRLCACSDVSNDVWASFQVEPGRLFCQDLSYRLLNVFLSKKTKQKKTNKTKILGFDGDAREKISAVVKQLRH